MKVVDPSANPYFATAAILGLALDGIERGAPLPPETPVDPATLSEQERKAAGTVALSTEQAEVIAALDGSSRMRAILGIRPSTFWWPCAATSTRPIRDLDPQQLTDKFRMAWSL